MNMGNFDFGAIETQSYTSSASKYLKPYGIYKVVLKDISLKDLKGSKNPDAVYKTVYIEFAGKGDNEGEVYQHNLFIPSTEEDAERPTFDNGGTAPSRFENYRDTLMQIVEALNPEGATKIKANGKKINEIAKSKKKSPIDIFNGLVIEALKGKNDVEVELKLVGKNVNGTIYADLPKACAINSDGTLYSKYFIGKNLKFTNYEQQQADKYKNAKPTAMPNNPDVGTQGSDDDFSLDDLANDLD